MSTVEWTGTVDELRQLAEQRHVDPPRVLCRASELLARDNDPAVVAVAHWVIGLALHEMGQAAGAVASYRRSVAKSLAFGLVDAEALARAGMVHSLMSVGDAAGAEREMIRAREVAPPSVRGAVEMLYGVYLVRAGQLDGGLAAYQRALRFLEREGDRATIARLRLNRGILHAYQGRLDIALEDLGAAENLAVEQGLPVLAAMAAHNTGFSHGRRGSLPDALAAFDRAERAYAVLDTPERLVAVLQADRCEVLLLAGLVAEARAVAEALVAALGTTTGDQANLDDCRLLLARALLADGAYDAAVHEARAVARRFRAARRLPWAALAKYVAVQAEVLLCQDQRVPPPDLLGRSRRMAAELEARGWPLEALHVRTFVGRLALAMGRPAVARAELARASHARSRGTADQRAQAWYATALLRLAEGNERGAKRALDRGMAVVDEYRATVGATEMRAHAASYDADLVRLGLRLALRDGRPRRVLHWAERRRAGALRRPPVCPPDDDQLAADLAELRRARSELRETALAGGPQRGLPARIAAVERKVRDRALQTRDDRGSATGRLDVDALRSALGPRALVEYVAFEGGLRAVTLMDERLRLVDLGPALKVEQEIEYLQFALRRLLSRRSGGAPGDLVSSSAQKLDDLLVGPLGVPSGVPLVVVPTGTLHGLPWSCLPSLSGRDTTVAPSAALWLGDDGPPPLAAPFQRVALVAGPQLPGAAAELHAVAGLYPAAEVLTGHHATVSGVCAALERADMAHVAAHGSFRADSPMFSSLLMADGPLTVFDLERLRSAPRVVVLPACHAAVSAVRTGDELLGTAAALLGLGVRMIVAPVMAVPDDATAALMVDFHHQLRAGHQPAAALARVAAHGHDPVATGAFLCIGCNDRSSVISESPVSGRRVP